MSRKSYTAFLKMFPCIGENEQISERASFLLGEVNAFYRFRWTESQWIIDLKKRCNMIPDWIQEAKEELKHNNLWPWDSGS